MSAPSSASKRVAPPVEVLGRFHVLSMLDEDELGTTNLARLEGPDGFQRWLALRLVRSSVARDAEFERRFYAAARAGAGLTHPNVATTLEVGETNGVLWLATEYLHGERLSDVIARACERQTPLPWDIACRIASELALGLDALHELRSPGGERMPIVHGRFAPCHATVTYDGKSKVLGVPIDPPGGHVLDALELPYAAPEVIAGDPPSARGDTYAVAVILWELICGQRLFAGDSAAATRARIAAHRVPPLRPMSLGCPERVDRIVARATAMEPEERFPSARDLAQALQAALVSEALVVTDDDVGRQMVRLFGDEFAEREECLRSAADVTEVFRRGSPPPPREDDTVRALPTSEDDATLAYEDAPARTQRLPQMVVASDAEPAPSPAAAPVQAPRAHPSPAHASAPRFDAAAAPAAPSPAPRRGLLASVIIVGTLVVLAITAFGLRRSAVRRVREGARAPIIAPSTASAAASTDPTGSPELAQTDPTVAQPAAPSASTAPSAPAVASAAASKAPARPAPKSPATGAQVVAPPPKAPRVSGATGLLTVVCVPACDQVFDGRTPLGPSPVFKVPVAVGAHRIRLRLSDPPLSKNVDVVVNEDETTTVRESME